MGERPKVCFDRILPRDLMRFQATVRGREGRVRAISPIGKTWMNGSTLRVRFMSGSASRRTGGDAVGPPPHAEPVMTTHEGVAPHGPCAIPASQSARSEGVPQGQPGS
jgi:hypothetical protein